MLINIFLGSLRIFNQLFLSLIRLKEMSGNKFKNQTQNIACTVVYHVSRITDFEILLPLFRMGLFGVAHGWEGQKDPPLPKICYTHPTMMKLIVIFYLEKDPKIIFITGDTT